MVARKKAGILRLFSRYVGGAEPRGGTFYRFGADRYQSLETVYCTCVANSAGVKVKTDNSMVGIHLDHVCLTVRQGYNF